MSSHEQEAGYILGDIPHTPDELISMQHEGLSTPEEVRYSLEGEANKLNDEPIVEELREKGLL